MNAKAWVVCILLILAVMGVVAYSGFVILDNCGNASGTQVNSQTVDQEVRP